MSPVVRVDDDVWEWLKTQARPLEDTPNSVLRRVAGIDPPLRLIVPLREQLPQRVRCRRTCTWVGRCPTTAASRSSQGARW